MRDAALKRQSMTETAGNSFLSEGKQEEPRLFSGIRWRWGVIAAIAMSLLSLWPQIDLVWHRGSEWNGAFAHANYDEEIYAAYLNGMIEGRPRVSDPLIELQDGNPPPESLFSIQFTQPMLFASAARLLGLSTSSAFIVLSPLFAFLSTLALFLLLSVLTADERLGGVGAVFILCFGTLAGWGGKVLPVLHLGITYAGFPFLRRYQPGLAFPLFFVFILLIWYAFTRKDRSGRTAAWAAGLVFAVLVFSYFYMWTAALAWVFLIALLWIITHWSELRWSLMRLVPVAIVGGVTLAAYAFQLARIESTTGATQVLEFTHWPDLVSPPLIIGLIAGLLTWRAVRIYRTHWADPLTLFTLSFALLPLSLLNQQVITGRSLQPVHYEMFIGNYVALLALVLSIFILKRRPETSGAPRMSRALAILGLIAFAWGAVEINYNTRRRREHNVKRDEFIPVAKRLQDEAAKSGRDPNEREVVFSPNTPVVSDNLTNYAPQAMLWALHAPLMPALSESERNHRFFLYLYYSDVTADELGLRLRKNSPVEVLALFGWGRQFPSLSAEFTPPTDEEIRDQVSKYSEFIKNFGSQSANSPQLSWLVTEADSNVSLSNLDRWYVRESEEVLGQYRLIRISPRVSAEANPPGER